MDATAARGQITWSHGDEASDGQVVGVLKVRGLPLAGILQDRVQA
jgi:hypothetical protein